MIRPRSPREQPHTIVQGTVIRAFHDNHYNVKRPTSYSGKAEAAEINDRVMASLRNIQKYRPVLQ